MTPSCATPPPPRPPPPHPRRRRRRRALQPLNRVLQPLQVLCPLAALQPLQVLYPARQKNDRNSNPRPIEWLEPERSLPEVIAELRNAVNTPQAREHLERLSKGYTKRDVERWDRVPLDTLPDARDAPRMAPRDRLGWPKDDL